MNVYILRRIYPNHNKGRAVVYARDAAEAIRIAEVTTEYEWVIVKIVEGERSQMLLYNID